MSFGFVERASSTPRGWRRARKISGRIFFLTNCPNTICGIDRLIRELKRFQSAVKSGDRKKLERFSFGRSRKTRDDDRTEGQKQGTAVSGCIKQSQAIVNKRLIYFLVIGILGPAGCVLSGENSKEQTIDSVPANTRRSKSDRDSRTHPAKVRRAGHRRAIVNCRWIKDFGGCRRSENPVRQFRRQSMINGILAPTPRR